MHVPARILYQAMELYLGVVYPGGVPVAVRERVSGVGRIPEGSMVPGEMLEPNTGQVAGGLAVRLGQPLYPHMKLAIDPVPGEGAGCKGQDFLLRVDAHDRHLHAPAGSPDEVWLKQVRESNRVIGEKVEAAWAAAGLPTFKEYLRGQLAKRKAAGVNDQ